MYETTEKELPSGFILIWDRKTALGSEDLERTVMKDEYRDTLNRWFRRVCSAGITYVTFVKSTGMMRMMRCSTNDRFLPMKNGFQATKPYNPGLVTVWDLDKDAWRTVPIDRLLRVRIDPYNMTRALTWEMYQPKIT